jgi:uncharacterized protein YeaO (DUF488 family)
MGKAVSAENVRVKRAYDPPSPDDGMRILVDRLWPRGVKKEAASIDHWAKELSPSTALRKRFGHDPDRWDEFRRAYAEELRENRTSLETLRDLARDRKITLVYAAREEKRNNAIALRDILLGR